MQNNFGYYKNSWKMQTKYYRLLELLILTEIEYLQKSPSVQSVET